MRSGLEWKAERGGSSQDDVLHIYLFCTFSVETFVLRKLRHVMFDYPTSNLP